MTVSSQIFGTGSLEHLFSGICKKKNYSQKSSIKQTLSVRVAMAERGLATQGDLWEV